VTRFVPLISFLGALCLWQAVVWWLRVPVYLVPGPLAIGAAFAADAAGLLRALGSTLLVAAAALAAACVLGVALACAMAANQWARAVIKPWAIILQVTPVVAVAPLIVVWVGDPFAAMVVCATIVAFFPVFSNTVAGLEATPPDLVRLPAALPYFLAGLRVSGGLALVGAVVAEFVTGAGGVASGLAFRILEAGYRLQIARMFACLALLSLAGLAINWALGALSRAVLAPRG
jgi:NitT/TauT family transport system permease protein